MDKHFHQSFFVLILFHLEKKCLKSVSLARMFDIKCVPLHSIIV